jgi:hypothetical protein
MKGEDRSMLEWVMSLGAAIIPVIAIAGGILVAVVAILAGTWHKNRKTEMEIALKQDMLNRGMSVEEIERVMRASRKGG